MHERAQPKSCFWGRYRRLDNESSWRDTKIGGGTLLHVPPPVCAQCGRTMLQALQLRLDAPLKLSSKYELAHVFLCPSADEPPTDPECDVGSVTSGANAVILSTLPKEVSLGVGFPYPPHTVEWEEGPEPIYWDGLQAEPEDQEYDRLLNIVADTWGDCCKLGGLPMWMQYEQWPDCPSCHGATRFAASFPALLTQDEEGEPTWFDPFFGGAEGYVFVCENSCGPHGGAFLYQYS
jgi:hypothetical protein